ncbi:MAG: YraN family protein [Gemmatimonadota bacterium]|nr:YraN family protein [Gemmatimonadota bacterium]MDH3422846.1 YraN family protein [Gemmatimonadota bacterium]
MPLPYPPHALGHFGESCARAYLIRAGWTVLVSNYRFGRREVDLVVRRGGLVAFVEVKTRTGTGFGAPEEAVTRLKRREIEAVARDFLWRHRLDDVDVRFDVIAIVAGSGREVVRIDHLEDAWRPDAPR